MTQQADWRGLTASGRKKLAIREYSSRSLKERLATTGVEAGELLDRESKDLASAWIPGVELFHRRVYTQRHRGFFAELVRRDEGVPARIGFWPSQWATARMYAQTAKGFHIHPPFIPPGESEESWFKALFIDSPEDCSRRPYDREQWDMMFFVAGLAEMILVDERAGLPRRIMRFFISGDDHAGANNVAVIIPPGVAHAIRSEGSDDLIMVYGTSTTFRPAWEGRIAAEVEIAALPPEWQEYLSQTRP
jgi:dTDP-4-dehydrorhamnose 3,5-epimerase-like enzyme